MQKGLIVKISLLFLIFFGVSLVLGRIFNVDLHQLRDLISGFGIWAPLAYVVILTLGLSVPLNPISDYLVVNLAAILLPLPFAIIATFIAHTISLSINYFIGRNYGWKFIEKFTNEKEQKYLKNLSENITPTRIFFLRWLLPLTAVGVDVVSYAAGISKISFKKFFVASIIPWTTLNILFFNLTKFAISKSAFLFFVPGVMIILTPLLIHLFYRNRERFRKILGF